MAFVHIPAMPGEVAHYLDCRPGHIAVDCTLGGSGHAVDICNRISPSGRFVGIDQDADAIEHARNRLSRIRMKGLHIVHDNFDQLRAIMHQLDITAVDRILLDLGLSLHQLTASGRGFSFQQDEPLDMRMDTRIGTTAADLVNTLGESELRDLFRTLGEERRASAIARRIVMHRRTVAINTTAQLVRIVMEATPPSAARQRIHPATRVFMALRIAVNRELERLERFLADVPDLLRASGRLCVLSFHSLEDRIVKHQFKSWARPCTCPPSLPLCVCGREPVMHLLTPRVVRPSEQEIASNPMARSTRLRAVEKRG